MPPPTSSRSVDPGNIIRFALALESIFPVSVGFYYIFCPRHFLLHQMEAASSEVTTTAIQITRQFGAMTVLFGAILGLFISNTRNSSGNRQMLYFTVLVFELFFVPLLVWQAYRIEGGGMSKSALLASAMQLVPLILWRVFTLVWKQEWFGRWQEGKKME